MGGPGEASQTVNQGSVRKEKKWKLWIKEEETRQNTTRKRPEVMNWEGSPPGLGTGGQDSKSEP